MASKDDTKSSEPPIRTQSDHTIAGSWDEENRAPNRLIGGSGDGKAHGDVIDEKKEKRINAKLDACVLSIITLCENCWTTKGFELVGTPVQTAVTVTYVPYMFAELPSNLILKKVGAHIWLPFIVIAWGIVSTLQGLVSSYTGLIVARAFLGLAEGGILPGITLYLSGFYRRRQLQLRVSTFFTATSLAGAFSGLLAAAIVNMDGIGGRKGWQWIFILEGIVTVLCGVITAPFLPRNAQAARFLSADEKELHQQLMDNDGLGEEENEKFSWKECGKAVLSPHVWMMAVGGFFSATGLYGLAYFAPSIVGTFGYNMIQTQLRTVPPYVVSTFGKSAASSGGPYRLSPLMDTYATSPVGLISAYFSDRYQARGVTTIVLAAVGVVGFAINLGSADRNANYAALFLQTTSAYGTAPALSAWLANNLANHYKKATGLVILFLFTNAGGILSTWLFDDPPRYKKAATVLLIFFILLMFSSAFTVFWLAYQNRLKTKRREELAMEARRESWGVEKVEARNKELKAQLGDEAPGFRYTL